MHATVGTIHAIDVSAWATVGLAVLTATYVVVTARLVKHTRDTAYAAHQQVVAQRRPLLVDADDIRTGIDVVLGSIEARVSVLLVNVGGGPAFVGSAALALDGAEWPMTVTRSIIPVDRQGGVSVDFGQAEECWNAVRSALDARSPVAVTVNYTDVTGSDRFECQLTGANPGDGWLIREIKHKELPSS